MSPEATPEATPAPKLEPTLEPTPVARTVQIEVVWGSVTECDGDVHVVGHYQGVLPQYAEEALDIAVSGLGNKPIIRDLTERGVIRGALGDVYFIPWDARRVVAVAGMGVPGTFGPLQLQKLVAGVVSTVGRLSDRPTMTSVLIGSGVGTMPISDCIPSYLEGLHEAFTMYKDLAIDRLRLVEHNLDRAITMLALLKEHAANYNGAVSFKIIEPHAKGRGRKVPVTFSYSMLLAAVAKGTGQDGAALEPWLEGLLKEIPSVRDDDGVQEDPNDDPLKAALLDMRGHVKAYPDDLGQLALCFPVGNRRGGQKTTREIRPTRVVFSFDGNRVRTSAITETTTASEREVGIKQKLFDELIRDLTFSNLAPNEEMTKLGRFAFERLVHPDMEKLFKQTPQPPVILEITRSIAGLPFEMLVPNTTDMKALGLTVPVARQLRTAYSPPPISASGRSIRTALVLADPGEGPKYGLPDCRKEGEAVRDLLKRAGIEVTLLVGSPDDVTGYRPPQSEAASMLTALRVLFDGVDLVHYCGHGVYDPIHPDLSGWVFGNGNILSAEDLRQMRTPPLLVVANACVSSQLSQRGASRPPTVRANNVAESPKKTAKKTVGPSDTELIAGLADEFFRQGVRDFVGAAFNVPDKSATVMATEFYTRVLGYNPEGHRLKGVPMNIGSALLESRGILYAAWQKRGMKERMNEKNVSPTWGAYQHYGDPQRMLVEKENSD